MKLNILTYLLIKNAFSKYILLFIHFLNILKAHRNIFPSLMISRTLRSYLSKRRIGISIFSFHSGCYFYSFSLFFKYTHIINFTYWYLWSHISTAQPYTRSFSLWGFHRYQKNTNEIMIIILCWNYLGLSQLFHHVIWCRTL